MVVISHSRLSRRLTVNDHFRLRRLRRPRPVRCRDRYPDCGRRRLNEQCPLYRSWALTFQPGKLTHGLDFVECVLHRRVRQRIPLLHEVDTQHRFERHHLLHLGKELLPTGHALLLLAGQRRKACLFHRTRPPGLNHDRSGPRSPWRSPAPVCFNHSFLGYMNNSPANLERAAASLRMCALTTDESHQSPVVKHESFGYRQYKSCAAPCAADFPNGEQQSSRHGSRVDHCADAARSLERGRAGTQCGH